MQFQELQSLAIGLHKIKMRVRAKFMKDPRQELFGLITDAFVERSAFVDQWVAYRQEYKNSGVKSLLWFLSNIIYRDEDGLPVYYYPWDNYRAEVTRILELFDKEAKELQHNAQATQK